MVRSLKVILLSILLVASFELKSAINSRALNTNSAQLVSLNLKIKSNNQTEKTELLMPFYQVGELERKIGDKNVLIELSPKHGKNADEITLGMKFYNSSGSKAFYKKEIVAKINEESLISYKGMSFKITPVLN
jgi:hypothetical protein